LTAKNGPAHVPHAVQAEMLFKMLLIMIREREQSGSNTF